MGTIAFQEKKFQGFVNTKHLMGTTSYRQEQVFCLAGTFAERVESLGKHLLTANN